MTNSFEHYSLDTKFGAEDKLFGAIMTLDKERVGELKANGAALTENVRNLLENGSGRKQNTSDPAVELYFSFVRELKTLPSGEFAEILTLLRAETDKPLYFSETLWFWGNKRCFEPEIFGAVLKAFEQRQMSKKKTMREIIGNNALDCLPICEKNGWLKNPKTRDELIKYANESGKTECAAWLLEFKNRTADLAAEQAKAEKKMLRELNADPNSLTELKKIWSFKKRDDGTLVITGYKGDQKSIAVPEKIGNDTVTAIGEFAFSPNAPRLTGEKRLLRARIETVVVPPTVKTIERFAFGGYAYDSGTHQTVHSYVKAVLPPSLDIFSSRQAADGGENIAYLYSTAVLITAVIPRMENAEYYCKINKIPYTFMEDT